MPERTLSRLSGLPASDLRSPVNHIPQHEVLVATMSDGEMHEFLRCSEKAMIGKKV